MEKLQNALRIYLCETKFTCAKQSMHAPISKEIEY